MSDDFIKDFAIPGAVGVAAKGLTEKLVTGTRLGAERTGEAIADALQADGVKSLGTAAGLCSAIITYSLLHAANGKPKSTVNETSHGGTIGTEQQQHSR